MTVEIPFLLSRRPRDRRGFPIPYVVFIDDKGDPHFTINDMYRVREVLAERLCGLCGKPHKLGQIWFIGGAGAAFHEQGAYIDPPVHEACGRYAVQVCPYIAAPNYGKRIEHKTLKAENVSDAALLLDNKMDPTRPPFFVLSRASGYHVIEDGIQRYVQPRRPWKAVEFWRQGEKIDILAAEALLAGTEYEPENLYWWPRDLRAAAG